MNKDRSPGWDGIPPEFYLKFWDQLGPLLLEMINIAISKGSFGRDVNMSLISLLLKKGKDPNECSNWRPLSLINTDVKLFSKVLSCCLEKFLPKLIHPDQSGFVKKRLSSDNLRRLLHIVNSSPDPKVSSAVLSVDAEKAFDHLEWLYLRSVLKCMGLGDKFINMVKILFSNPSTSVITGNICSPPFKITRGTRQGDPISPILFILSMEPLAQTIRQAKNIKPITLNYTDHHISLYADDILLYLEDISYSLPNLLDIFDYFSSISSYKMNQSKSSLMYLRTPPKHTPTHEIPIVPHFKYLGIDIFPSVEKIVSMNYNRILKSIIDDLNRWSNLPVSFAGRISVIKMNILPRVNFCSDMIPIAPPSGYWEKLHKILSKFIWKGKRAHVKLPTLQNGKQSGGLAVPNFKLYFQALSLRPLLVWFDSDADTPWKYGCTYASTGHTFYLYFSETM